MDINQMLRQTDAVGAISRELGIDPAMAEAGAAALLPSILGGLQHPVGPAVVSPTSEAPLAVGGLGGLFDMIGSLGGGALLDNVASDQPTEVGKGNQILGQIFGSKDGSRAVAAEAAAQSGVEPSLLKRMLPILAMAAAGYFAKQAGQGSNGGFGDIIGGMLGGPQSPAAQQSQPDILGNLIGAAGKILGR